MGPGKHGDPFQSPSTIYTMKKRTFASICNYFKRDANAVQGLRIAAVDCVVVVRTGTRGTCM